jgi:ICP0-binding domain of Ubiquitin-specific protease 7
VSEERPTQRRPYQGYWDGTPFVFLSPHKEVRDTISLIIKHYVPELQTLRYCGFKRFSRFISVTKVLDDLKALIGLNESDPVDIYDCWRRVPERVDVTNTLESLCLRTGDILVLQRAGSSPTFDALSNSADEWKYPFPAQGPHRYIPLDPPKIATPDIGLQLYEYATQRKYTDIIICNPDATVAAYAHKPVLATLAYFQRVFDHPGALEACPRDQFGHALFPAPEGTSQISMYAFLRFLYTHSWDALIQGSTAQLLEIIRLAEFYEYTDLFARAVHHFELAHFDIDVALDGLGVASRCTSMISTTKEKIKGLCLSYLVRHWGEVAKTERFKALVESGGDMYEMLVDAVDKALK